MATSTTDSLSEFERRAEASRAELAQTVDALHSRVSPSAIKADVKGYVRDNPLQAAAIAVGAAYPVWRMIGAMPAPVLLIGAGLALARRTNSSTSYSSDPRSPYGSRAGNGVMADLKEKASDVTSQIAGKAQETVESVRNVAADTASRASDSLSDTYDSARRSAQETMYQASEKASATYARASEQFSDLLERHPALVGGVAFALGSIVASAVPVSRQENRLMGETAQDLRRRSQDLAEQGLREATDVAQQVYRTATDEIRQEGLTPEAARRTARTAVDSAREAIERTASSGGNDNRS